MHLVKTGGTSLIEGLRSIGMPPEQMGHFCWQDRNPRLKTIVIIRNPLMRVISHYNDLQYRWGKHPGHTWVEGKHPLPLEELRKMSLTEFAAYRGPGVEPNLQTTALGPSLRAALDNVKSCIVFRTETLEENWQAFGRLYGLDVPPLHKRNTSPPHSRAFTEYDAETLIEVTRLNADDRLLWQSV